MMAKAMFAQGNPYFYGVEILATKSCFTYLIFFLENYYILRSFLELCPSFQFSMKEFLMGQFF